jgi:hypothetical protein
VKGIGSTHARGTTVSISIDLSREGHGLVTTDPAGCADNLITPNPTSGNATDLFHTVFGNPNKWQGNSCETKSGAEIQDCQAQEELNRPARFMSETDRGCERLPSRWATKLAMAPCSAIVAIPAPSIAGG